MDNRLWKDVSCCKGVGRVVLETLQQKPFFEGARVGFFSTLILEVRGDPVIVRGGEIIANQICRR